MNNPRLHPDTIEDVKQRTDIVDIISDYVVLKKRGKDFIGLCPFHDEKTPSFTVSPGKQMYYCFGCNAGGNSLKFLMELKKQSFAEAVLDLAKRYQVEIKTLNPEQHQEFQRQISFKEQLLEIMAVAASFYQHVLHQSQGEIALNYLKQQRQLNDETIQSFGLGYAPEGWETLYRYLIEQKRYSLTLVQEAGLIKPRKTGSGYYDQFRDRLMIPILDTQGRVIAFGSRTLGNEEPKYLNSPETPLFDKSKTLFALNKAKQSIIKTDQVVVVEGYFDAIALHAANIKNVVASLGTAFNQDQLKQLSRYTQSKQIVFNFDADKAGIQATIRAIEEIASLIYSGQVQLKILNLPNRKDADEFLKSSPTAIDIYRKCLKDAPLWLDWQIQHLLKEKDLKSADQFQQVAKNMVQLLSKLEDKNLQEYYIDHFAEILAQGDSRLKPLQAKSLQTQLKKPSSKSVSFPSLVTSEQNLLEEAEKLLLLIYLHYPEHRAEILSNLEEKDLVFSVSHHRFFWQQIIQIQAEITDEQRLFSLLQDRLLLFPEQQNKLTHFFQLNDTTTEDIFRAKERVKHAIASLELVNWKNYQRYCLQQCTKFSSDNNEQLAFYTQEIDKTRQKIEELDQLRMS